MSSLMADFDMVMELSNPTLLNLLKSQVQIAGQALNPPFEVEIPISGGGISGTAHMIIDDVTLDLNSDDTIALNFIFGSASVDGISGLDGNFTVTAPVLLGGPSGSPSVAVNFANANVGLNFTPESMSRIANAFPPDAFRNFATQALQNFFRGLGLLLFPLQFTVVSGQNGSLSPLSFVRLEVHCIPHQDRNRQALALFGILLVANSSRGDSTAKTETAIPLGQDICVSLSPGAFHSIVFCPAVATAFGGVNVSLLPPTCGSSSGIERDGVTLTRLSDAFSNGRIFVNVSFEKSGFCYRATGSLRGELTVTVAGTTLTPVFTPSTPRTDFDIPWYCTVAAGVLTLGIGAVIAVIAEEIGENVVQDIAESVVTGFGGLLPSINIPGVAGVTFQTVLITPEGLSVCGTLPPITLPEPQRRRISLTGSVVTSNETVLSRGTFHDVPCPVSNIPLPPGGFPYTELQLEQIGTYEAHSPSLLGRPLSYEWWLSSGNNRADLTGASGTASIVVDDHFPFPLPAGTSVTHQVQIGYTINNTVVELTNAPTNGRYSVQLHITATDPSGRSAYTYAIVIFTGHWVNIGGGYHGIASRCMREMWRIIRDERLGSIREPIGLPPIPPPDHPPIEDILDFARETIKADPERAERLLADATLVYGESLERVWESPEAWNDWLTNRRTHRGA